MSDFKKRLTIENDELVEKTCKLEDFLATDEAQEIDEVQLMLLRIQLNAMNTYLSCLQERIGRL